MSDLDDLARLNDEEWADKPYTIELRGGQNDGRRFRWHELPLMWRQPEPPPLAWPFMEPGPITTMDMRVADYRPTGSVRDDGTHIYEFHRHE